KKGQVTTYRHSIPKGGWFEFVSCPHYFAEILIYFSFCFIFAGRHITWWIIFSFVLINQVVSAIYNHQWYLDAFKNYPKHRKAVIPFLI
ncbi:polyprenol reductase-like protein, partial [Dinothrombium tinctorium]